MVLVARTIGTTEVNGKRPKHKAKTASIFMSRPFAKHRSDCCQKMRVRSSVTMRHSTRLARKSVEDSVSCIPVRLTVQVSSRRHDHSVGGGGDESHRTVSQQEIRSARMLTAVRELAAAKQRVSIIVGEARNVDAWAAMLPFANPDAPP